MSEHPTVYEAWNAVMRDVQAVRKDSRNKAQGFNFRGIDAVMNAAGPAMREHGVAVIPSLRSIGHRDVQSASKGSAMREVTVEVGYTIIGPNGDGIDCGIVPGEALDSGDKATAKAMSVAYRTFLLQALTIPTDDPDPDEHSYERASAQPPAQPVQPELPDGMVWVKDAKTSVAAAVAGDVDQATKIWDAAVGEGLKVVDVGGWPAVSEADAKTALDIAETFVAKVDPPQPAEGEEPFPEEPY